MAKNRVLYIVILFLSFLFPYLYGGKIPYMVLYTVLLLPCLSLIHVLVIFFRFKYVQEFDKKYIVKGDTVNFKVRITNEDFFLYPYLNAVFSGENSIFHNQIRNKRFSLPPYSSKTYTFALKCRYRGSFEVGLERLEITDILGLFTLKYRFKWPRKLVVYPRIVHFERLHMQEGHISESKNTLESRLEDMTMISGIRKYIYGDVYKKIHWKLTAKIGELMVKDFQNTSETSAVVLLDLFKNSYPPAINMAIEDKVIEAAVSIINYCLLRCIPIKFIYCNDSIVETEAETPLDFEDIYSGLAEIQFNGDTCAGDLLELYLKSSIETENLFVVTSNIDDSLVDNLYAARLSGFHVYTIYVSPDELTNVDNINANKILEFLPEINVRAVRLSINDDLKNALEGA